MFPCRLGQWSADDNISGIILVNLFVLRNFCEIKHYFGVKRKLNKISKNIYTPLFKEVECIVTFMGNNILLLACLH